MARSRYSTLKCELMDLRHPDDMKVYLGALHLHYSSEKPGKVALLIFNTNEKWSVCKYAEALPPGIHVPIMETCFEIQGLMQ